MSLEGHVSNTLHSPVFSRISSFSFFRFCTVHLGGGIWGVLSAPIFNKDSGILYDGGLLSFRGFGWNLLGVIVIMIWSGSLAFILFLAMNLIGVLRVDKDIELKGKL